MQIKTPCGLCTGGCRVEVTVEDGRITGAVPDRDSPLGRVCVRGAHVQEMLYGEQRIKKPLIRTGPRGSGQYREASWDEALDVAAGLLRCAADTFGGPSIVSYMGRGLLGTPAARMALTGPNSFVSHLGSPNSLGCGSICNMVASNIVPLSVVGMETYRMVQDIEHSEWIFVWGKNAVTDNGPQMLLKRIRAARQRGAKLVVIDPRRSGLGEEADLWIPITPGTDGALALAMMKMIIASDRCDRAFVAGYTHGFDELKDYLDTLELGWLAERCGVSLQQIAELTDIFCSTQRISLVSYTGLEYQPSAVQNGRAVYALWAITGKLDVEGGIYLSPGAPVFRPRPLPEEGSPVGAEKFPLFYAFTGMGQFAAFPEAVLRDDPYPVRALILAGGSPVTTWPDSALWRRVYEKLDCLIVMDRYFTEDTRYADVVFPVCTMYEMPVAVRGAEGAELREALIPPVGEARSDIVVFAGLADRLGFGDAYPQDDAALRKRLLEMAASGPRTERGPRKWRKYADGTLRADGAVGFPTPTGKVELCSTLLEDAGVTPWPEYTDPRGETPQTEFPFTLTTGARSLHRMGVVGANLPFLAQLEPEPLLELCSEDAANLGLEDGELARVTTPYGSGVYRLRCGAMASGAAHIPHGGGSAFMPKPWCEGNVNELCSMDRCDPISGYPAMKAVPCRVEKLSHL